VVLVVDQFEEAFTLCQDSTERQQFFDCLLGAVAAISVVALTGLAAFAGLQWYSAQRSAKEAKQEQLKAQTQTVEALFIAGKKFDALVEAVQIGLRKSKNSWMQKRYLLHLWL
jgi:hypothetical protein